MNNSSHLSFKYWCALLKMNRNIIVSLTHNRMIQTENPRNKCHHRYQSNSSGNYVIPTIHYIQPDECQPGNGRGHGHLLHDWIPVRHLVDRNNGAWMSSELCATQRWVLIDQRNSDEDTLASEIVKIQSAKSKYLLVLVEHGLVSLSN